MPECSNRYKIQTYLIPNQVALSVSTVCMPSALFAVTDGEQFAFSL